MPAGHFSSNAIGGPGAPRRCSNIVRDNWPRRAPSPQHVVRPDLVLSRAARRILRAIGRYRRCPIGRRWGKHYPSMSVVDRWSRSWEKDARRGNRGNGPCCRMLIDLREVRHVAAGKRSSIRQPSAANSTNTKRTPTFARRRNTSAKTGGWDRIGTFQSADSTRRRSPPSASAKRQPPI